MLTEKQIKYLKKAAFKYNKSMAYILRAMIEGSMAMVEIKTKNYTGNFSC